MPAVLSRRRGRAAENLRSGDACHELQKSKGKTAARGVCPDIGQDRLGYVQSVKYYRQLMRVIDFLVAVFVSGPAVWLHVQGHTAHLWERTKAVTGKRLH